MSEGRKMTSDDATKQLNTMYLYERKNLNIILKCFENQVNEIKAVLALTKPTSTCSKSTMETPEQCVKSVQN